MDYTATVTLMSPMGQAIIRYDDGTQDSALLFDDTAEPRSRYCCSIVHSATGLTCSVAEGETRETAYRNACHAYLERILTNDYNISTARVLSQ